MTISPVIEPHLEAIRAVCRAYGVARLDVFGSVQTDRFDPETSDIDFLVEYPDGYDFGPWLGRLQDFQEDLAKIVGYPVDVVRTTVLRRAGFRLEIEKTRAEIYRGAAISRVA